MPERDGVPARRGGRRRDLLAAGLMLAAVLATHAPPDLEPGGVQLGCDYLVLHARRMEFAREALLGPGHALPGWYPRELLGTPFWSNVHNFPFHPSRLLLLALDPRAPSTYPLAVGLSAGLAALFTYLFARRLHVGPKGAAVAGWTFACNGNFAGHVLAGHLPLLEAYPGLPLLLWTVESLLQALERGASPRPWIVATALGSTCLALAGHPQLPIYSFGAAVLYALCRGGGRRGGWAVGAVGLGVGCASFALVPMALLAARSTRMLALAPAINDVSLPYGRLLAFFLPWRDGAVTPLLRAASQPFTGYPNSAYFWDTVGYAGWAPWLALVVLAGAAARAGLDERTRRVGWTLALLGAGSLLVALPAVRSVTSWIPGTVLRSPARMIYVTELALAVGLGAAVHWLLRKRSRAVVRAIVPLAVIAHGLDVGEHAREFSLPATRTVPAHADAIAAALGTVGDGRAAVDFMLDLPSNRGVDDVGFFDSIMLARSYRTVLALAGAPADANVQCLCGSELPARGLAAAGVRLVVTTRRRDDLHDRGQLGDIRVYAVPSPSPRAELFEDARVRVLPPDQLVEALRSSPAVGDLLLLPGEGAPAGSPAGPGGAPEGNTVEYARPDSDRIECAVTASGPGYLRVLESWDPGWAATVDGAPAPIVPAMNALLAVRVPSGRHLVVFTYRTPGAWIGAGASIASVCLLVVVLRAARRPPAAPA